MADKAIRPYTCGNCGIIIFPMPAARVRAWLGDSLLHIDLDGAHWRLRKGKDLEELWNELDPALDPEDRIPYWTELWPASLLLAEFLLGSQSEIAGRVCIDLGCGLGFTALLGSCLGARMLGIDFSLDALSLASSHAALNLAPQPRWLCMDWNSCALRKGMAWRIWAGDIMYEKRFARPLLEFMAHALAPAGRVWIAEPGRAVFRYLLDMAAERGWLARPLLKADVAAVRPQKSPIPASIWEFSRQLQQE